MSFTRTGVILYVDEYVECVDFYRDVIGLPVAFDTPDLTCFEFGASYLMVERGDDDHGSTPDTRHSMCLRINVPDVRARADALARQGIGVDYQEHDWGTVAKFTDPAGNLCAFKDDETFEKQMAAGPGDVR
ncbi:glyoxalase [Longibacter salinarum]|uniref:Glyoxalase n=1 Tax=Longibacter salinarum TaxID=1850348 RepID=A0A2A8CVI9_9BACT|nr:VOC family protein [Longibacter salinarum]PEN12666.1 glyoxalase [Longibacter salinarum]